MLPNYETRSTKFDNIKITFKGQTFICSRQELYELYTLIEDLLGINRSNWHEYPALPSRPPIWYCCKCQ